MTTSGNRQTLAADGQTDAQQFVGPVRVSYTGDFGSGTAKIQAEDPSEAFIDIAGSAKAAAADFVIDFPPHAVNLLQTDLAGSSSPAFVVWIQSSSRNLEAA